MAAAILTYGVSDYFFDDIAPIFVTAALEAEMGAIGLIDLSPQAVQRGLIGAAVSNHGGTLPDWWNTSTSGNSDFLTAQAKAIAEALGSWTSPGRMHRLHTQLHAQYCTYGCFVRN